VQAKPVAGCCSAHSVRLSVSQKLELLVVRAHTHTHTHTRCYGAKTLKKNPMGYLYRAACIKLLHPKTNLKGKSEQNSLIRQQLHMIRMVRMLSNQFNILESRMNLHLKFRGLYIHTFSLKKERGMMVCVGGHTIFF